MGCAMLRRAAETLRVSARPIRFAELASRELDARSGKSARNPWGESGFQSRTRRKLWGSSAPKGFY